VTQPVKETTGKPAAETTPAPQKITQRPRGFSVRLIYDSLLKVLERLF